MLAPLVQAVPTPVVLERALAPLVLAVSTHLVVQQDARLVHPVKLPRAGPELAHLVREARTQVVALVVPVVLAVPTRLLEPVVVSAARRVNTLVDPTRPLVCRALPAPLQALLEPCFAQAVVRVNTRQEVELLFVSAAQVVKWPVERMQQLAVPVRLVHSLEQVLGHAQLALTGSSH